MKSHRVSMLAAVALVLLHGCGGGGGVEINTSYPPFNPPIRNTDFVAQESFTFDLASPGRLRLALASHNGSIVVNGRPAGSNILVTGERRVGSDSLADAQAQLPLLQVEVHEVGADLLVTTRQPQDTGGRSYIVDYQISLPSSLALSIANVNGSIEMRGMTGNVETNLVNGRTEATLQVPAGGAVDLTAVNGDIALHLPPSTSADLSAHVAIGTIVLLDLPLKDELRSNTLLQGTLGAGGATLSLKTSTGSIRIDAST